MPTWSIFVNRLVTGVSVAEATRPSWPPEPFSGEVAVPRFTIGCGGPAGYSGMSAPSRHRDAVPPLVAPLVERWTGRIEEDIHGWIGHRQRRAHAHGPAARLAQGLLRG